jgi:hypothetical protein
MHSSGSHDISNARARVGSFAPTSCNYRQLNIIIITIVKIHCWEFVFFSLNNI